MTPPRKGGRPRWDAPRKAINARRLRNPLGEPEALFVVDEVLPRAVLQAADQDPEQEALWLAYLRAFRAFKETVRPVSSAIVGPDEKPAAFNRRVEARRQAVATWYRAGASFLAAAANYAAGEAERNGAPRDRPAREVAGAPRDKTARLLRSVVGFLMCVRPEYPTILFVQGWNGPPWTPAELEALRCAWNHDPRLGTCRGCRRYDKAIEAEEGCTWRDGPRRAGKAGPLPWTATAKSTIESTLRPSRLFVEGAGDFDAGIWPFPLIGDLLDFAWESTDPKPARKR